MMENTNTPHVEIPQPELIRAATNAPELSTDSFTLGDRTFKVMDLEYDSYLKFLTLLQPLAEAFFGKALGASQASEGVPISNLPTDKLSPTNLIQYCGTTLPEMVRIVCAQTDPDITVNDVKSLGRNPFKLATVALLQIKRNNVIQDFLDFFAQVTPLLKSN